MAFIYIILGLILLFISVNLLKQRSELAVKHRLLEQGKVQIEDVNKKLDDLSSTLEKVEPALSKVNKISSQLLSYQKSVKH